MHFLGVKITFGESGKTLVKYGEMPNLADSAKNPEMGAKTPTQYRSNAHFRPLQKLQKRSMIYPYEDRPQRLWAF